MPIYIIRHAQSTNNTLSNQRDRVHDASLTPLGKKQANILAKHLAHGLELSPMISDLENNNQRSYGITRLYCSPMWRSLQTAEPVGKELNLSPEIWTDLHEQGGVYLDHGVVGGLVGYPGKSRREILAEFPSYILPSEITDAGWWNKGHEEITLYYERALRVASELKKQSVSNDRIVLISHSEFMDILIKTLLGQMSSGNIYYASLNTSISRIDIDHNGHISIRYLNRIEHLPSNMIT